MIPFADRSMQQHLVFMPTASTTEHPPVLSGRR